jgi:outer membrane lipoprotein-sorting protein
VVLALEGGAVLYLRRGDGGALQLRAARRDGWQIEYGAWEGGYPRSVRLLSTAAPQVDMTAQLSQLEANVDLDRAAFEVNVPPDALPITLDELRSAGPLRLTSR